MREVHTVLRADAGFALRGARMVYTYDDDGVEISDGAAVVAKLLRSRMPTALQLVI